MEYTAKNHKSYPKSTGVYSISFNGGKEKMYVGSASGRDGFRRRWRAHLRDLRLGKSPDKLLFAYLKYGESNMVFRILIECPPEMCLIEEQKNIEKYNSFNNGYNSRPLAKNNKGLKFKGDNISKAYLKKREKYYTEVSDMYKSGFTTREISEKLKIGRDLISKILKETSTDIRKNKGLRKKKIFRYDKNGNFIDSFDSITECSLKTGINSHSIDLILKGLSKFTANFYFFHTEEITKMDFHEILKKIDNQKFEKKILSGFLKYEKIDQINQSGELIRRWDSINSITKEFGILNQSNIYKAIREKKLYKKFYWVPYYSGIEQDRNDYFDPGKSEFK